VANLSRFNPRDLFGNWWDQASAIQRGVFRVLVIALFYALPLLNNPVIDTPESSFQSVLFYPLIMFSLMAVGLNVVVGKSGILDLGYVAFFAIGAYTHALFGLKTDLNFYEILPIAMGMSMLAGVILGLPALRLRGDYLAIITLGFGEIVRIVALNIEITGGPNGIPGIPNPPTLFGLKFDLENQANYFWLVLALILLTIWMIRRFTVRRPGRAWEAIRQDEDVAALMGVNTLVYKLWSFVIGAAVGGAAGVIYASKVMVISPDMFKFELSILILACVVFGGIGNIWGVILGAGLLAYLPERIRFLSDTRQLVFGLVLIIMMNLRPDGLLPRKKREKIEAKRTI
jgi:branched-chain amino acid transport system permease protein